ncbi:recombinase family protein [Rhodococcus marinonascens]|uniref:recombinase family protein n=1 Tax=Rhodococcus marinonascens TaxID=38311 RepID=UPI000934012C|nr:recombinase family protein [Rhodococcus marinonascens]
MRAVIYTRMSRDRTGAGLGIGRQREDCETLAAQLSWEVVEAFEAFEAFDISAYSGRVRPGYRAMLKLLDSGQAEAVLAWHTDRLHRSPAELEEFITLCERRSVTVRTVQAGELDLSGAKSFPGPTLRWPEVLGDGTELVPAAEGLFALRHKN